MTTIRKMQGRDIIGLGDLFPNRGEDTFNDYHVGQLQDKQVILVAFEKTEDETTYIGYVTIVWESAYTQFWRRNIPEIVDLNIAAAHRKQGHGSALIAACEDHARDKGYETIGISVVQSPTYTDANRLYLKLGYAPDGFGITEQDNEVHLVKTL